jgi:hypothetical protein
MALESISTRVLLRVINMQKISSVRKATMLRMLALKSPPLHVELLTVPVRNGLPLELERVDHVLMFRLLVMLDGY